MLFLPPNPVATLLRSFLGASLLSVAAFPVHAATTLWEAAHNITHYTDVQNTGELKYAYRFRGGRDAAVTVNQVVFNTLVPVTLAGTQTLTLDQGNITFSNLDTSIETGRISAAGLTTPTQGDFLNLSSDYRNLLSSAAYSVTSVGNLEIRLNDLTVGQTYRIQVWGNESRIPTTRRTSVFDGSLSLINNMPYEEGGLGQYGIGTFVADATSQSIVLGRGHFINALSVFAVPEPTSLPMVGLAALFGWISFRRRR